MLGAADERDLVSTGLVSTCHVVSDQLAGLLQVRASVCCSEVLAVVKLELLSCVLSIIKEYCWIVLQYSEN